MKEITEEERLKADRKESASYWFDVAKETAQKGYVPYVIRYLDKSRAFAIDSGSIDLIEQLNREEKEIMDRAYRCGVKFELGIVEKAIEFLENHKADDPELLILCVYGGLKKAWKYSAKNIEIMVEELERMKKFEGKLNSLGLQEYLYNPIYAH